MSLFYQDICPVESDKYHTGTYINIRYTNMCNGFRVGDLLCTIRETYNHTD